MHANLSEWAINHRILMIFFMILAALAGVHSYFSLGQNEDPNFTIKTMVVRAYLPGADISQTSTQLTDRIEKKLEETPNLDYLKSYTTPGETTIFVNLLPSTKKNEVDDIWYQVRKKVGDIVYTLPSETVGPYFDDEFGDTYGMVYAFIADGFTHRELRDKLDEIRTELLRVPDVAKVISIGEQNEKYYVEFSTHRLAELGISRNALAQAIARQNALTPAGVVDTGNERIEVETSGRMLSVKDIAGVDVYAGNRKIRLGDVATVRHAYSDPPQPLFRFNGHDAIGLAISMRNGGDVLRLEKNITATMKRIIASLPVGIEARLVANQPHVVRAAVNEFMEALLESVAIVLGISFLSLGVRAGTVVACSIPLVLAFVFFGMRLWGIDLQRVSLGALIIALGLLVDDAMITIESMVSRLEAGWTREKAATYAYVSTAFPMLTGTLVTIFGFIPIGLARSTAGEYTFSLFAVVGMALLVSWFVAVLFAPTIAVRLLRPDKIHHKEGNGRVIKVFHVWLLWCMRHPWTTVLTTLTLFCLSLVCVSHIPQQFFPASERPELLVDMTLRQGVSIRATDALAHKLDNLLANDPDVDHWSTYVGRGAIRFYLPLDEQLENDFFSQTVVVAKSAEVRNRVNQRIQKALDEDFPEIVGRAYAMELGPPVGWPVQYRISGRDPKAVRSIADDVVSVMARSPKIRKINLNWGTPERKLKVVVRQDEAARLGLSSSGIAQALYTAVTGATVTTIRDGIYLVDVVLRAREDQRCSIEALNNLDIQLPGGKSVPLSVVADLKYEQDYPLIWRRDRQPCITVQASVCEGAMPENVAGELTAQIDLLRASLPEGYRIVIGGPVEESAKSTASVVAVLPLMTLLMLAVLMIQLQNFRHLVLVICVAPLGLIGVVLGLGLSHNPMGFVALLGIVALIGMIIRNSVILVHQIGIERNNGLSEWDAVVAAATVRFRPIMLTAVAAILGMLPIAPTVFWGPMANAIMGGLAVATALTLLFLPALYVLWLNVKETPLQATGVAVLEGNGGSVQKVETDKNSSFDTGDAKVKNVTGKGNPTD